MAFILELLAPVYTTSTNSDPCIKASYIEFSINSAPS